MAESPIEAPPDLKDHVMVCGWSRRIPAVIEGLAAAGALAGRALVLVNQAQRAQIDALRPLFPGVTIIHVVGPYHQESTLRRAACAAASVAVVVADTSLGPDADNRTIISMLAIKNLNGEAKTCAELLEPGNEPNLRRTGVDEVVVAGANTGFFLAAGVLAPGLAKAALSLVTPGSGRELRRAAIPESLLNRPFADLQEHARTRGAMVIGLIREAGVLTAADIFGSGQDWIDVFIKNAFTEAGEDVVQRDVEPIRVIINPADEFVVAFKDWAILVGGRSLGDTDG